MQQLFIILVQCFCFFSRMTCVTVDEAGIKETTLELFNVHFPKGHIRLFSRYPRILTTDRPQLSKDISACNRLPEQSPCRKAQPRKIFGMMSITTRAYGVG